MAADQGASPSLHGLVELLLGRPSASLLGHRDRLKLLDGAFEVSCRDAAGHEQRQRLLEAQADIDADAWASLYQTESRPFDPPSTGKIAVKVINDYGDEVMKVYTIE